MAKKKEHTPFELIPTPVEFEEGTYLWKGVSAALQLDELDDCLVIISAPNEKILRRFWEHVADCKLDISKGLTTAGNFARVKVNTEVKLKKKEPEKQRDLFWIYDRKADKCFMHCEDLPNKNCRNLGLAKRRTAIECKILLRDVFNWDKEDINEVEIDLNEIPW